MKWNFFIFLQEYLVPEEYVQTMRESMLNKCPVSSSDQVYKVFKKELGETPDKVCIFCDNPVIQRHMDLWKKYSSNLKVQAFVCSI